MTVIQFPGAPPADEIYPWPWEILDGLPFVDPAPPRNNRYRNCWNDKPTDGPGDCARGKHYGQLMLAAMQGKFAHWQNEKMVQVITARSLQLVFESMVRDAIARQRKGGKYSRTIFTTAATDFLCEICRYIAGDQDGH